MMSNSTSETGSNILHVMATFVHFPKWEMTTAKMSFDSFSPDPIQLVEKVVQQNANFFQVRKYFRSCAEYRSWPCWYTIGQKF